MGPGRRATNRQINSLALGASTVVGGGHKINEIGAFWKNKAGERGRKGVYVREEREGGKIYRKEEEQKRA